MAYWQLLRAESPDGSLLNAGYALQWPLFGVFFAVLWWRMLRSEARLLEEITQGAQEHAEGGAGRDEADRAHRARDELAPVAAAPAGSPFGPRPAGVATGGMDARPAPGSGRDQYNAWLAELADRGTPHTPPRATPDKEHDPS
jgi:hypothetical protein